MALVILLVVVLAVAAVGIAMASAVVREIQIATNGTSAVQARYLAEAGLADAAAHLSQDNTWVGPITQSLGAGSYTVRVDTTVSNSAVRSIVSTGQVFTAPGVLSAGVQTVRETLLVLPQAFSKALVSNTTFTAKAVTGITPTVTDTVLRQLGTLHANNLLGAATSVTLPAGTAATGQITASSGTISISGTCIACASANNLPTIPFPTFNFSTYTTLATNNTSPCPGVQSNTLFTTQASFNSCITAVTADASGVRTINGVWFMNAGQLILPSVAAAEKLTLNGTLVVYSTTAPGCSTTAPCGNLIFATVSGAQNQITITPRNGEPAVLAGGSINTSTTPGTITINGLVYGLAQTTNPVSSAPVAPGYNLTGSSTAPITIKGMLVGQLIGSGSTFVFDSNSLTYDPSSFFPGLPSGLVTPTAPPFVILPLSWSSGK